MGCLIVSALIILGSLTLVLVGWGKEIDHQRKER